MAQCYRALGKRKQADEAALMGERILNERQKLSSLQHQIRSNPNRLDFRENYAKALMEQQKYLMAADQYRYIAQHRPNQPKEWLPMADALEKGGEVEMSRYLRDYVRDAASGKVTGSPGGFPQ